MKKGNPYFWVFITVIFILFNGCASYNYSYKEPAYEKDIEKWLVLGHFNLSKGLQDKVLSLDPDVVTGKEIEEILSHASAPRIINIHGGIFPVHLVMESFSKFLISMGYPEEKIRNPGTGAYSHSCYESSRKLAGLLAWYYEKEGMRPMVIGHSQGGIQAVKVLHQLAGSFAEEIPVWNPLENRAEERFSIIDPVTGRKQPVVGLKISYATAVGSGGLTRFLPNQWVMINRLRSIPDSVDEFTGFYMGLDVIGGDFFGFGSANKYEPNGTTKVRNVKLPLSYSHVIVPSTSHLAENRETIQWINRYVPSENPSMNTDFESSSANILWAADVWHSIKKHWVLELQRLINAKRNLDQ